MTRRTGRQFFSNPGPTNIPDSVLREMNRATVDFNDPEFMPVYNQAVAGLKRVLQTEGELFFYTASGHGSWEATLVNMLSPGDTVLVLESGYFSEGWADMARSFGIVPQVVKADWRRGIDPAAVETALRATPAIKAVLTVHNETATGMATPLAAIRAAMDAAGSDALLLVDTISSLGSIEFRMDDWGIDGVVGGSQKGLMLPTGFSFTAVSKKGMAAHAEARCPRHYFNWAEMVRAAASQLCGHYSGGSVLWVAGEPAADRDGGAGRRGGAASSVGGGDAAGGAGVVGQCGAAALWAGSRATVGQRDGSADAGRV